MPGITLLYHFLLFLKDHKTGKSIKNGLIIWAAIKKNRHIRCQCCSIQGPAERYCKCCAKPIDQLCVKFHETITRYQYHSVLNIRGVGPNFRISNFAPERYCKYHRNQSIGFYCSNSGVLLCDICKENGDFNIESIEHFFALLDSLNGFKVLLEEILHARPDLPEHSELTTMVTWIAVSLGLNRDYDNFTAVPLSSDIQGILDQELNPSNQLNIRCNDVKVKIEGMARDMRLHFLYASGGNIIK